MFQAWNSVVVTNQESQWHTQAGTVIRTEKRGDIQLVHVRMDADGSTEPFDSSELQAL